VDFTELKVAISSSDVEIASAICHMTVPYGVYIEDYSDIIEGVQEISGTTIIDEALLTADRTKAVIHIYINPEENPNEALDYLREHLSAAGIVHEVDSGFVREEDWANNWKAYFKPIEVGNRLVVCPTWEEYKGSDAREILHIDPGSAFGTGTHATTRLCLETLEKYIFPDCSVLDVGTGSGILAIAARLLGAGMVYGIDIDKMAVKVAAQNAAQNSVQDAVTFGVGNLTEGVDARYNIIVANIVADVVEILVPDVAARLRENGFFIACGIIDSRVPGIVKMLKEAGFDIIEEEHQEGWAAIVAKISEGYEC